MSGNEKGYECDDEKNNNDNECIRSINLPEPPINIWHSGTYYRVNEVYEIWKQAFDNCNNDKTNQYDMNSNEILNRTTNTEGNKTESSSTDNIEIDLYAKRSRLNRAESDSEIVIEENILKVLGLLE